MKYCLFIGDDGSYSVEYGMLDSVKVKPSAVFDLYTDAIAYVHKLEDLGLLLCEKGILD